MFTVELPNLFLSKHLCVYMCAPIRHMKHVLACSRVYLLCSSAPADTACLAGAQGYSSAGGCLLASLALKLPCVPASPSEACGGQSEQPWAGRLTPRTSCQEGLLQPGSMVKALINSAAYCSWVNCSRVHIQPVLPGTKKTLEHVHYWICRHAQ